jgi:DNA primase
MALGPIGAGAVHLAAPTEELVLAEGIETALSVLQATGKPVWACLGTSGLKAVILPPEVKTVVIAADADEAGEKAAQDSPWTQPPY